jgi:hypothetical protein
MKKNALYPNVAIGQIRKLDSIKGIASARLVAIAETDSSDATCLVFLLGNATDAATPRDIIIPKEITKLTYDLALMSDYLSRADQGRLVNNPVLSEVSKELIEAVRNAVLESPFGALSIDQEKLTVSVGSYPAQKYDAVWNFRDSEAQNFALLTFTRNKTSIDFAFKLYQANYENLEAFCEPDVPIDAIRFRAFSKEKIEVAA